jgi:hypothetical protein
MVWVVSITPQSRFSPGERTPGTHWTGGWFSYDVTLFGKASFRTRSVLQFATKRLPPASCDFFLVLAFGSRYKQNTSIYACKYVYRYFDTGILHVSSDISRADNNGLGCSSKIKMGLARAPPSPLHHAPVSDSGRKSQGEAQILGWLKDPVGKH